MGALAELRRVRQVPGEPRRRWFSSEEEDLIVWYADDGGIFGFQFCYDRSGLERAVTWKVDGRIDHEVVDAGEPVGLAHKRAPVLRPALRDGHSLAARFRAVAHDLPAELAAFVGARLSGAPRGLRG